MTAIQPTRIAAVRGGVIAGNACLALQGSHGQFVLDAATAGVTPGA
jgi:predicted transglutaminase-like cysteine proteinase